MSMSRLVATLLAVLASLVLPALAQADDPLLSGYGAPGAGNQELLGSVLLTPGRAPDPVREPVAARRALVATPANAGSTTAPPSSSQADPAPATTTTKKRPGAPTSGSAAAPDTPVPARPVRVESASLVPVSAGRGLVVLVALVLLAGLGLAGARLRRPA